MRTQRRTWRQRRQARRLRSRRVRRKHGHALTDMEQRITRVPAHRASVHECPQNHSIRILQPVLSRPREVAKGVLCRVPRRPRPPAHGASTFARPAVRCSFASLRHGDIGMPWPLRNPRPRYRTCAVTAPRRRGSLLGVASRRAKIFRFSIIGHRLRAADSGLRRRVGTGKREPNRECESTTVRESAVSGRGLAGLRRLSAPSAPARRGFRSAPRRARGSGTTYVRWSRRTRLAPTRNGLASDSDRTAPQKTSLTPSPWLSGASCTGFHRLHGFDFAPL